MCVARRFADVLFAKNVASFNGKKTSDGYDIENIVGCTMIWMCQRSFKCDQESSADDGIDIVKDLDLDDWLTSVNNVFFLTIKTDQQFCFFLIFSNLLNYQEI